MREIATVSIGDPSAVVRARRKVFDLAEKLGFGNTDATRLAVLTSDLTRQLCREGKEGRFVAGIDKHMDTPSLSLIFEGAQLRLNGCSSPRLFDEVKTTKTNGFWRLRAMRPLPDGAPVLSETFLKSLRESLAQHSREELTRAVADKNRELKALNRRLSSNLSELVEKNADAILVVDKRGRVAFANAAATELFGRNAKEINNLDLPVVASDKREAEIEIVHPTTGEQKYAAMRQVAVDWRGGSAALVTLRDITQRKLHEKMKDEFISTVNHELRTPLTAIGGSLKLVVSGVTGSLPDAAQQMTKVAHSNCNRLLTLVNDLLQTQALDSGKVKPEVEPLSVCGHVEEVIASLSDYATDYNVGMRLVAADADAVALADSGALIQILTNLVSNAVKFSPAGSEVTIGVETRERSVLISVRDHGPGIPETMRDKIFERFFQIDATDSRQKGGTGLGLSIVKKLVAMMDGQVSHEPGPGGGTIFKVALPRAQERPMAQLAGSQTT